MYTEANTCLYTVKWVYTRRQTHLPYTCTLHLIYTVLAQCTVPTQRERSIVGKYNYTCIIADEATNVSNREQLNLSVILFRDSHFEGGKIKSNLKCGSHALGCMHAIVL